jgi:hypothetical protein
LLRGEFKLKFGHKGGCLTCLDSKLKRFRALHTTIRLNMPWKLE